MITLLLNLLCKINFTIKSLSSPTLHKNCPQNVSDTSLCKLARACFGVYKECKRVDLIIVANRH